MRGAPFFLAVSERITNFAKTMATRPTGRMEGAADGRRSRCGSLPARAPDALPGPETRSGMVRRTFILAACLFPVALLAQNVWDKPDLDGIPVEQGQARGAKPAKDGKVSENRNPRYLVGAVPEVDGEVEWELDMDVPGKPAERIYESMLSCLDALTKEPNQIPGSNISLVDKENHAIVASIKEWLVFRDSFISIDRAKFFYTLFVTCGDGHLNVKMQRASYKYDEENGKGGYFYKAEEIITDSKCLNKSGTKVAPGFAKFRKRTIERKDALFGMIADWATR